MPRRVSLPGADELFGAPTPPPAAPDDVALDPPTPSGRVRHDEKITVYVTPDELIELEHTRLELRREHQVTVDRGRLIREAIHIALQDVATRGDSSALVSRLRRA